MGRDAWWSVSVWRVRVGRWVVRVCSSEEAYVQCMSGGMGYMYQKSRQH